MPLEATIVEVDGQRYQVGQLPWLEGAPVYRILVKAAGDALISALLTMPEEQRARLAAGDRALALPLVMRVVGNLEAPELDVVIKALGKVISVAVGDTDAWTNVLELRSHFSGRYAHMLHVYWLAAAHNFSDPS